MLQATSGYHPHAEPQFEGGASGTLSDPNFPWIVNVRLLSFGIEIVRIVGTHRCRACSNMCPAVNSHETEEVLPLLSCAGTQHVFPCDRLNKWKSEYDCACVHTYEMSLIDLAIICCDPAPSPP